MSIADILTFALVVLMGVVYARTTFKLERERNDKLRTDAWGAGWNQAATAAISLVDRYAARHPDDDMRRAALEACADLLRVELETK